MKLFHKIIAKFSVLQLLSSALSPPLTRRIAHQNDNTGDVKPGKEGHLTVAFRFLSLHQSLCRPPPPATGDDYPGSFRCGY